MKTISLFTLILFCFINRIYGQKFEKAEIPFVKESKEIDSLMDHIINTIHIKGYFLTIDVTCSKDFNNFFIMGYKNDFPTIDLPGLGKFKNGEQLQYYQDNLQCFTRSGVVIFVKGNLPCISLFKSTNRSKAFLFKMQTLKSISFIRGRTVFTDMYKYQHGMFELNHVSPD